MLKARHITISCKIIRFRAFSFICVPVGQLVLQQVKKTVCWTTSVAAHTKYHQILPTSITPHGDKKQNPISTNQVRLLFPCPEFKREMAVGTKECLYLLLFKWGSLTWGPEGRNWNSECKGWELSERISLASLIICLVNRSVSVHCSTPRILLLVFITLSLSAFFDLVLRLPNQQRRVKVSTDSIYAL